jgi:hypothetical protein
MILTIITIILSNDDTGYTREEKRGRPGMGDRTLVARSSKRDMDDRMGDTIRNSVMRTWYLPRYYHCYNPPLGYIRTWDCWIVYLWLLGRLTQSHTHATAAID